MLTVKIFKDDVLIEERQIQERTHNATKHKSKKDTSLQEKDKSTTTEVEEAEQ